MTSPPPGGSRSNGSAPRKTSPAYPTRTKVIVAVVVAIAVAGFVVAGLSANTDPDDEATVTGDAGPASIGAQTTAPPDTIANGVVSVSPGRGAQVLAQEPVGITLLPGWTGSLTVRPENGEPTPIPDDQLEDRGANVLRYLPRDGRDDRVLDRLPAGRVCVDATIWDQVRGRSASERVETWCFDVT